MSEVKQSERIYQMKREVRTRNDSEEEKQREKDTKNMHKIKTDNRIPKNKSWD